MAENRTVGIALDADYLVFSCLQAAEKEEDWGDDIWTLTCDHGAAKEALRNRVEHIQKIIDEHYQFEKVNYKIFFVFSDKENWRLDLLPTYKFNRKKEGVRKPVGYTDFVEQVMVNPEDFGGDQSTCIEEYEADDTCATMATIPYAYGCEEMAVVSVDKDFYTIPNTLFLHLKVDKTPHELTEITQEDADYWHLYQGMKGDITDGYSGIKGVGEQVNGTCIHKWLREPTFFESYEHTFKSGARKDTTETRWRTLSAAEAEVSLWDCIVSLGAKAGMTEAEVLVNFQMARLLRASDSQDGWRPEDTPFVLETFKTPNE